MDVNGMKNGDADARGETLAQMKAGAQAGEKARGRLHAEAVRNRREKRMLPPRGARRWGGRLLWRLIVLATLVVVIIVLLAIFLPKAKESLKIEVELPETLSGLLPDNKMGYNKIQFQDAILGETREKSELVVLEQDVEVSTEISQALANIALFEKTKTLISYGTGIYAVDLSGIGAAQIALDEEARLVTVVIPHATLAYVNFDVTKTESGQTKRALFGFGDIKLTTEQMTLIETSVDAAMREKLGSPEALLAADERALKRVSELLDPLVKSVAAEFSVVVVMD